MSSLAIRSHSVPIKAPLFSRSLTQILSPALASGRLESKYAAHSVSFEGDSSDSSDLVGSDSPTSIGVGRACLGLSEFRIHVHYSCSGHACGFASAEDLASASLRRSLPRHLKPQDRVSCSLQNSARQRVWRQLRLCRRTGGGRTKAFRHQDLI